MQLLSVLQSYMQAWLFATYPQGNRCPSVVSGVAGERRQGAGHTNMCEFAHDISHLQLSVAGEKHAYNLMINLNSQAVNVKEQHRELGTSQNRISQWPHILGQYCLE